MRNLDFAGYAGFSAYCVALLVVGIGMLVLSALSAVRRAKQFEQQVKVGESTYQQQVAAAGAASRTPRLKTLPRLTSRPFRPWRRASSSTEAG